MAQEDSIKENNNTASKTPAEQKPGKSRKEKTDQQLALQLALIEHGSRPLAMLLIGLLIILLLFWAKDPLFNLLGRAQELKIGSFEVRLQSEADVENLGSELQALRKVSPNQ